MLHMLLLPNPNMQMSMSTKEPRYSPMSWMLIPIKHVTWKKMGTWE